MSHRPINRSADLTRLREEGYDIDVVQGGLLVVSDVPYVTSQRTVARGRFICKLVLADDETQAADDHDHTIHWEGEYPCEADGTPIEGFRHSSPDAHLGPGLVGNHYFSYLPKPKLQYDDYYHKISVYVGRVTGAAQVIDKGATAKTKPLIEPEEDDECVFLYLDNATGRSELNVIANKLALQRLAIVGLGGTGAYVLDLVAKTRAKQIHLYDGDTFSQHNAFRAPGAASGDELRARLPKVDYLKSIYAKMRTGIEAHPNYIGPDNINELRQMDFVFICMDRGEEKRSIVRVLEDAGVPFIDVGLGVYEADGALAGAMRVTASADGKREHVWKNRRIKFTDNAAVNEYDKNIQIADLNMLNATLAVIRWKKMFGFYHDLGGEWFSTYRIAENKIVNEDVL